MNTNQQPKFKLGQKVMLHGFEQWEKIPCEPCKGRGGVKFNGYTFVCDYCRGDGYTLKTVKVNTVGVIIRINQRLESKNNYELDYDVTTVEKMEKMSSKEGISPMFERWTEEEVERNLLKVKAVSDDY